MKKIKCSICGKPIEPKGTWTHGNNADPINLGRCCDKCDSEVVIPARLAQVRPSMSLATARAIGRIAHEPWPVKPN